MVRTDIDHTFSLFVAVATPFASFLHGLGTTPSLCKQAIIRGKAKIAKGGKNTDIAMSMISPAIGRMILVTSFQPPLFLNDRSSKVVCCKKHA